MGTNYYAHIIPTKKRKLELCALLCSNDFKSIIEEVNKTYGTFELDYQGNPIGGQVHLGKASGGWKFLWNPNVYVVRHGHIEYDDEEHTKAHYVFDPNTSYYLYPLTKAGIWNFINRSDVEIFDEYNEKQDKEKFFKEALEFTKWNGKEAWDSDSYYIAHPNEYVWKCKSELIDLLESEGFNLSTFKHDFYSDGLRFSTSTEFS